MSGNSKTISGRKIEALFTLLKEANSIDEQKKAQDALRNMLDLGINPNVLDSFDMPLIYYAAYKNNLGACKLLVEAGADVNLVSHGETALYKAASLYLKDIVLYLLSVGASVEFVCDNGERSALISALSNYPTKESIKRVSETANALINAGARVNFQNDNGESPLFLAAQSGNLEVGKMLVKAGADINRMDNVCLTPLQKTVSRNRVDFCKFLLGHGAEIIYRQQLKPLSSNDALSTAVRMNKLDILKELLAHCPNAASYYESGLETPLHEAARIGRDDMCALLLQNGFNVNTTAGIDNKETPLHFLCFTAKEPHTCACKLLLDAGADVNAKNAEGNTPLLTLTINYINDIYAYTYTIFDNYAKIIELLLNAGADVNVQNNDGNTVLHILSSMLNSMNNNIEPLMMRLVDLGADPGIKNVVGQDVLSCVKSDRIRGALIRHSKQYVQKKSIAAADKRDIADNSNFEWEY